MKISLLMLFTFIQSVFVKSHAQQNSFKDCLAIQKDTRVCLADKNTASYLLATSDEFTQNMSIFDLQGRLRTNKYIPTEDDYLKNIGKHAKKWRKRDEKKIKEIIENTNERLSSLGLNLTLPHEIVLVKTNGKDEGGAAYTRANYIILNNKQINEETFIHELFHIYSRHNPQLKDSLYDIIGFKKTTPIKYPDVLKEKIITNPDTPQNSHYLSLRTLQGEEKLMMITYSKRAYQKGNFFDYLNKGLLSIEIDTLSNAPKAILSPSGQVKIYNYNEVSQLERYIGKNTSYNIHPEEISAEHFAFVLMGKENLANQELLVQMIDRIKAYEAAKEQR